MWRIPGTIYNEEVEAYLVDYGDFGEDNISADSGGSLQLGYDKRYLYQLSSIYNSNLMV